MKLFRKIAYVFANFRSRYRLSFRKPHNDREIWYMYMSPLNILMTALAFVLVTFVVVVTAVAFTPVMDFIPGYPGSKARMILMEGNMRLDSLERRLETWNAYYENLVRIMDGRPPMAPESVGKDTVLSDRGGVLRVPEDSVLRTQLEGDGVYRLPDASEGKGTGEYPRMFAPVKGVVRDRFDPQSGLFGVNVSSTGNQPVMSAMEGTVVHAAWTPAEGSVIYVLHPGNFVSAYLHTSRLLKKTGDRVGAGEVIAFTGNGGEQNADRGYVQFQLWYNGSPVDPENYIVF